MYTAARTNTSEHQTNRPIGFRFPVLHRAQTRSESYPAFHPKSTGVLSPRVKLPEPKTNQSLLSSEEWKSARAKIPLQGRFQVVAICAVIWALTLLGPRNF